jgi:hypothetical protein
VEAHAAGAAVTGVDVDLGQHGGRGVEGVQVVEEPGAGEAPEEHHAGAQDDGAVPAARHGCLARHRHHTGGSLGI